ncbi:hypothetical protein H4219_003760 [Mycoemilia scoparia]|uniref:Uncharacterized protein n=1 Tax=Mycoemilia scoparia TaxID=417184 RepID=A0A9W7ZUN0_9FUNG|nr:hypothetical protein H4219_003760 [Mycoemilia scoparia]
MKKCLRGTLKLTKIDYKQKEISTTIMGDERELSGVEKYQLVKRLCNTYGNLIVGARVVFTKPPRLPALKARFVKIVQQACHRYPLLFSVIIDELTKTPKWQRLQESKVSEINPKIYSKLISVKELHSDNFHDINFSREGQNSEMLSKMLGDTFDITDKTKPLWKLCVLIKEKKHQTDGNSRDEEGDGNDAVEGLVVIVADHLITDATGAMTILKYILKSFNHQDADIVLDQHQLVTGADAVQKDGSSGNRLPKNAPSTSAATSNVNPDATHTKKVALNPGLDTVVIKKPNFLQILRILPLRQLVLPSFLQNLVTPKYWAAKDVDKLEEPNTQCFIFTVSASRLSKLRKRAMLNNSTSVHAALWRIVAESMALTLTKQDPVYKHPVVIRSDTPFNARSFCNFDNYDIASYHSTGSSSGGHSEPPVGNFTCVYTRDDAIIREKSALVDAPRFWKYAKAYRHELIGTRPRNVHKLALMGMIGKFPGDWIKFFTRDLMTEPRISLQPPPTGLDESDKGHNSDPDAVHKRSNNNDSSSSVGGGGGGFFNPVRRGATFEISNLGRYPPECGIYDEQKKEQAMSIKSNCSASNNSHRSLGNHKKRDHSHQEHSSSSGSIILPKVNVINYVFAQSANIVGPVLTWNFVTTTTAPTIQRPGTATPANDPANPRAPGDSLTANDVLTGSITWQDGVLTDYQVRKCYSLFCEILDHVIKFGGSKQRRKRFKRGTLPGINVLGRASPRRCDKLEQVYQAQQTIPVPEDAHDSDSNSESSDNESIYSRERGRVSQGGNNKDESDDGSIKGGG